MSSNSLLHRAGFSTYYWDRFLPLLQSVIPSGGAVSFQAPVDQPGGISAWRAVISDGAGAVDIAQPVLGVVILGISITAAVQGANITLIRTGTYTDPSWSWTPGQPIILGNDGVLTQTPPPGAQVIQPLGLAISSTRLIARIDQPLAV